MMLKPLAASAEGRELRVRSGDESVVLRDVVVGEVWHASGQSNMAMTVGAMARELEPVKSDIAAARFAGDPLLPHQRSGVSPAVR